MKTQTADDEQATILETFKRLGKPIGEDQYHMIHQTMELGGQGLGLEFELAYWPQIDKRFKSNFGAVPYSSKLHNIIESLVKNNQLKRNPENPIELEYCGN